MSDEDQINKLSENMDNPAEYYLETLISDAFKGKGFQKISELFEDKKVFPSQRYSRVLLNQLDKLIHKELDRNAFEHVSLLMKCIQHFCKNDHQEGSSLIEQGLVLKMVLWFERTVEFLNIFGKTNAFISTLVEDFYDTALVIFKSNCEEGKKQLLDSFLLRLALVVTEKWPPCNIRLEALRTLNHILGNSSREDKKRLQSCEDLFVLAQDLAKAILEAGDYDIQVAILEALCRMMAKKWRDTFVTRWFEDEVLAAAFKEIRDKEFETDCRIFLNTLNSRLKDERGVYTFPCITAFADSSELAKPQDESLEHFWIDFNVASRCISFYINNTQGGLWDSVRLQSDELENYALKETDGQKVLQLYLRKPLVVDNKDVTEVKLCFEKEQDIQNAVKKIIDKDNTVSSDQTEAMDSSKPTEVEPSKQSPVVQTKSTSEQRKSDQADMEEVDLLSGVLFSPCSPSAPQKLSSEPLFTQKSLTTVAESQEVLIENVPLEIIPFSEISVSVVSTDSRSLTLDGSEDGSAVVKGSTKSGAKKKKTPSPENQSAKKKAEELYQFSGYPCREKVSEAKEKIFVPKDSADRKKTSHFSPVLKSTNTSKIHLFSESNGIATSSQSEKSWVIDFQNRSSVKPASYSRRKRRRKCNLKVLPLSSDSCDGMTTPSKAKLKENPTLDTYTSTPTGGKAKSLKSSELKLPGISTILTPQDSNVVNLSDLDDDIMDPLQETSSPNSSKHSEDPVKTKLKSGSVEIKDFTVGNRKRKRLFGDLNEEFGSKSIKLSESCQKMLVPGDWDNEPFDSDEQDLGEASVISAFEVFTNDLRKKFVSRYKRMEKRTHNALKGSHRQVSTLLEEINQCRLQKLDKFHSIVVKELSNLESETRALKGLENETMKFWEDHYVKMNTFCEHQKQRITAIGSTFGETMLKVTNSLENIVKID
uniref:Synaptonemal complex protein 2 like n=1 Tax=Leptobrachium leishanense TaxID=445787 RepID=A0A8C5Q6L2_9ANUR